MKILFLTDNFPPEGNAPASRTYEHCLEWVKIGAEVIVITCAPNFPTGKLFKGYKNKLYQSEIVEGIRVIRVWSYITPNRGFIRRSLDYMSFCIMGFITSLFVKADIIIATSPQLFTALAGYLSSLFTRRPWIMEVRDLWPESIKAVEAVETPFILKILYKLCSLLYKKASHIVVVTHSFKERMILYGLPEEKVSVVTNGVHLNKFDSEKRNINLSKKLGLENKFVVAYIGTHGMAHKLDFILDCLPDIVQQEIHFLFVGAGAMKSRLEQQMLSLGLENITMLDAVAKPEVIEYISISDIALIPLRKKTTFTKVLPSKIFENAAMQKPILLGVEGEAKELIEKYNAGLCFYPEDKASFLFQLEKLYNDKSSLKKYQEGCIKLAKDYDRKKLAEYMYSVILQTLKTK